MSRKHNSRRGGKKARGMPNQMSLAKHRTSGKGVRPPQRILDERAREKNEREEEKRKRKRRRLSPWFDSISLLMRGS
jgi:hypothetical protein